MKRYLKKVNGRELVKTRCKVCKREAPPSGYCRKHRHLKLKNASTKR